MNEVPLFPLPRVVFPTEPVPLHIFEPRYREMVRVCLAGGRGDGGADFVIVRSGSSGVAAVGCGLRITQVLRRYPDGRLDILARGWSRCRVAEVRKVHAYDTAVVEWLPDVAPDWDEALATRAFTLHRRLLEQFCGEAPPEHLYSGQAALSWLLAPSAGLSPEGQQALLECETEDGRLRALVEHLTRLLARLEEVQVLGRQVRAAWELRDLVRPDAPP